MTSPQAASSRFEILTHLGPEEPLIKKLIASSDRLRSVGKFDVFKKQCLDPVRQTYVLAVRTKSPVSFESENKVSFRHENQDTHTQDAESRTLALGYVAPYDCLEECRFSVFEVGLALDGQAHMDPAAVKYLWSLLLEQPEHPVKCVVARIPPGEEGIASVLMDTLGFRTPKVLERMSLGDPQKKDSGITVLVWGSAPTERLDDDTACYDPLDVSEEDADESGEDRDVRIATGVE